MRHAVVLLILIGQACSCQWRLSEISSLYVGTNRETGRFTGRGNWKGESHFLEVSLQGCTGREPVPSTKMWFLAVEAKHAGGTNPAIVTVFNFEGVPMFPVGLRERLCDTINGKVLSKRKNEWTEAESKGKSIISSGKAVFKQVDPYLVVGTENPQKGCFNIDTQKMTGRFSYVDSTVMFGSLDARNDLNRRHVPMVYLLLPASEEVNELLEAQKYARVVNGKVVETPETRALKSKLDPQGEEWGTILSKVTDAWIVSRDKYSMEGSIFLTLVQDNVVNNGGTTFFIPLDSAPLLDLPRSLSLQRCEDNTSFTVMDYGHTIDTLITRIETFLDGPDANSDFRELMKPLTYMDTNSLTMRTLTWFTLISGNVDPKTVMYKDRRENTDNRFTFGQVTSASESEAITKSAKAIQDDVTEENVGQLQATRMFEKYKQARMNVLRTNELQLLKRALVQEIQASMKPEDMHMFGAISADAVFAYIDNTAEVPFYSDLLRDLTDELRYDYAEVRYQILEMAEGVERTDAVLLQLRKQPKNNTYVWSVLLKNDNILRLGEDLKNLIKQVLSIPVATASVERSFSLVTHALDKRRHNLKDNTLNCFLQVRVNGPSTDDYDPTDDALTWIKDNHWKSDRLRGQKLEMPPLRSHSAMQFPADRGFTAWVDNHVLMDLLLAAFLRVFLLSGTIIGLIFLYDRILWALEPIINKYNEWKLTRGENSDDPSVRLISFGSSERSVQRHPQRRTPLCARKGSPSTTTAVRNDELFSSDPPPVRRSSSYAFSPPQKLRPIPRRHRHSSRRSVHNRYLQHNDPTTAPPPF